MTETTVTIERLGHRGDGIAPGPVFVPRSLPGEVVGGPVIDGRMAAPRILRPSPHRIAPPCRHAKTCGGCVLMHADNGFLLAWKEEVIRAALAAHGLSAPFRPAAVSPPGSRRRARLAGRRTKKGALVGFHGLKSDMLVPISECHVLLPSLVALLPTLAEITRLGASRSAELAFALTQTDVGVDCAVAGGKPLDVALRTALPGFRDRIARLTWEGDPVYAEARPRIDFDGIAVAPPPAAFLQATAEGEAALRAAVRESLQGATRIADLFAGCGTFALPLARGAPVHAVEGDAALLSALAEAARHAPGLKPVTTEARDLFRRPIPAEDLAAFDGLVIDPPRAGAEAQIAEIARARVPRVAMVSCNPVTLARDAAVLIAAGYRLNWVQMVDQFRWSPHVELAANLSVTHLA
jgi:23S rRNA (uracil1939-C5)-methyltransferase